MSDLDTMAEVTAAPPASRRAAASARAAVPEPALSGASVAPVVPAAPVTVTAGTQAMAPTSVVPDVPLSGIATRRTHTSRVSQVVTLVAVIGPVVGLASAMDLFWGVGFRWTDLVLFAAFYVVCGLGITVGYHRYFTHKSFETVWPVKVALAVLGAMTLQGPVTQWVTDHRKHHARSDHEGDPHSPHLSGDGLVGTVKGLWHAHLGWMFSTKGMERGVAWGKDLYDDRTIRVIDRMYLVWVGISLGLPFLLGAWIGGSWSSGVEAMVWAGLVRILAFEHATFAVNSVCHTFGRRTYDARDESRNNWVVALLVFGEGWHNNHHAFPRSARHGLRRAQLDISWLVIRGLEALRLARRIRIPTAPQLARAAATAATKSA